MNEKELISSAKKGDKSAFAQLYGIYKDKLYRYAYYRLGNVDDAEDAVCDTILSAYEEIADLRKSSAFNSWLFKLHYVTCAKYIKRQIEARELADIEDFKNSVKTIDGINTLSMELKDGLNILNDDEREIVLLSVIAGLKSNEISVITGLTDGSVRSKLSRSLAKMRAFLE